MERVSMDNSYEKINDVISEGSPWRGLWSGGREGFFFLKCKYLKKKVEILEDI